MTLLMSKFFVGMKISSEIKSGVINVNPRGNWFALELPHEDY